MEDTVDMKITFRKRKLVLLRETGSTMWQWEGHMKIHKPAQRVRANTGQSLCCAL